MAEDLSERDFYKTSLMSYARALAKLEPTPWVKVGRIMEACPIETSRGVFRIDQRSQDAFVALGVYYCESRFQHTDRIVPYLLKLYRGLPKCNLVEEVKYHETDKIPVMERFAFCVATVLNDAAFHCEAVRDEILNAQVDMLALLTRMCLAFKTSLVDPDLIVGRVATPEQLCFTLLPCLIGITRAMGRATPDPPYLISRIFPPESTILNRVPETAEEDEELFREELKLKTAAYNPRLIPRRALIDYWVNPRARNYKHDRRDHLMPYTHIGTPMPFDVARFLFGIFGSSFSQKCTSLTYTKIRTYALQFSPVKLQALLVHAHKMLDEDTLECFDETIQKVLGETKIKDFPYISVGEILRLVFVSLIYEVLCPGTPSVKEEWRETSPLTMSLVKDLESFAMGHFAAGLRQLTPETFDECNEQQREFDHRVVNAYRLNAQATAACVDILVWCQFDEAGADMLCLKLTEKVCNRHHVKTAIGHIPINIVCLEGIAVLGENFIYGADMSVTALRDFLLSPSELLMVLHRSGQEFAGNRQVASEVCASALRHLRETAVEALCFLLRLLLELDHDCVQAFLASTSYKVYQAEETEGAGGLVLTNAIITLGSIAVNLRGTPRIDMSILQFYQQRFCQPISSMDNIIIDQMGRMIVARVHRSVCDEIMKMFTTITLVSSAGHDGENQNHNFRHVSLTVVKVLMKVVTALDGDEEQLEMMGLCLELFVHLGMEGCRESLNLEEFRRTNAAKSMGVMIPVIAILGRKMKAITFARPRLHKMFWDFWTYVVMMGFTSPEGLSNDEWYYGMCDIAIKSPVLVCKEHLKPVVQFQMSTRTDAFAMISGAEIRNQTVNDLSNESGMDMSALVENLTFQQCSYVLAVLNLETLRVRNTLDCKTPLDCILRYIENPLIQQDKQGIFTCILIIAEKVYDLILAMLTQKSKDLRRDEELENHFIYLLVKFVDPELNVRKVSAKFLLLFTEHFPHMLWSRRVISTLFDLLFALSGSLHIDSNDVSPEIVVPSTSFAIQITNSIQTREEIIRDLASESQAIIEEALNQACGITKAHIQHYMSTRCFVSENMLYHSGVAAAIESVMLFSSYNTQAAPLAAMALEKWPACVKLDYAEFTQLLSLQCRYTGEVQGMISMLDPSHDGFRHLTEQLITDLSTSWRLRKRKLHRQSIYRVCGLLIASKTFNRRLLKSMCWAPVEFFTDESVADAVHCWEWFISARPELEIEFYQEMAAAWYASIDREMGLFAPTPKQTDPFAPRDESELKPNVTIVSPHDIWIRFLVERMENAKYSSQTQVDIFICIIYRSFSVDIGSDRYCNRHIDVLGPRYRLLMAGLSLLHSGVVIHEMSQTVLRERLYSGALDFFCSSPMCPLQEGGALRRDILVLIQFWMAIHDDRKFIRFGNFVKQVIDLQAAKAKEDVSSESSLSTALDGCSLPETPRGFRSTAGDQWGKKSKTSKSTQSTKTSKTKSKKEMSKNRSGSQATAASNRSNKDSVDEVVGAAGGVVDPDIVGDVGEDKSRENPDEFPPNESEEGDDEDEMKGASIFVQEYMQKRNLILSLMGIQIEFLITWYNPMLLPERQLPGEDQIFNWQRTNINDKTWPQIAQLAWRLSPSLAVFLPIRFRHTDVLKQEICTLVQSNPLAVSHIPEALQYLVTADKIMKDSTDLTYMLTWASISPARALSFFSRLYPPHPTTAQFAVRVLSVCPPQALLQYIPQLVQAVRYDRMGYITEFIIQSVKISQLLMHQFIWNMKTNMFRDEDGEEQDGDLYDVFNEIIDNIVRNLTGPERMFYESEFDFFTKMTAISGVLRHFPKGIERKKACLSEMSKIKIESGLYLPSSPESIIVDIDYASGAPMQSAAKAPYRAKFKVRPVGIEKVQQIATSRFGSSEADGGGAGGGVPGAAGEAKREQIVAVIFKVADDIRQDMLALQILQLLKNVFLIAGIDVYLAPYRVVATSPGCGVIECVPDTTSRDQMGRQTDISLFDYFIRKYGHTSSRGFQEARGCFIKSWAAYSVAVFLMQVKDRHNGNLLIDEQGHYIHIDFGFLFDSSPGGNMGFEPDIKITEEIVNIMGGSNEAEPFKWYVELCVRCFLAIRPYREDIITLVSLMLDTGLPCFRGQTIKMLRSRFAPQATDREAAAFMIKIVSDSYLNFRTKTYDMIQYYQNQIPY